MDPRFFFLYVSTEKDWEKLKSVVAVAPPSPWKTSSHYWNGIYLFMERALVLGENDLLVKWGRVFQKEGKGNARYADSLFLLAFGMAELKNTKEAMKILDELETGELSPKLTTQVSALRAEMKNE
ncbi:tetratricopeptide repeat protein [Leptospira idonii]|uniref:tetratricopeptide repeat protein n=1 Tax=Leptospira idonii TaxID=1193500 RepID=UPI001FE66F7C|nr:hypothetical protein [Leptospira idonii]